MPTTNNPSQNGESIILSPNPRLPILIILLSAILALLPINLLLPILLGTFGIFLLIQAYTLRLGFESEAMVVWQVGRELRRFPYKNWLAWRLLLPGLPGILYFREEASPHLLPILFDKNSLQTQLRLRLSELERPQRSSQPTS